LCLGELGRLDAARRNRFNRAFLEASYERPLETFLEREHGFGARLLPLRFVDLRAIAGRQDEDE